MWEFIKNNWSQLLCTGLLTFCSAVFKVTLNLIKKETDRIKKETEEKQIMKEGIVALLHDSLFSRCTSYISAGEMTTVEFENLTGLYTSYHALGGNGTGTALYEKCKALQIK